ncbi:MAG TPA: PAS domain S-box protein [Flavisolibacter sp.]
MMNQNYKVLHLEDVATDAELAAKELKKNLDFEHLVIDTEKAFLEALDNFHPDVILCDHSLPSFNSLEALKIVKRKKLHIPFILITATMSEEVAASVVKEGADDYILKDRLKRLPNAVLNAIEKYRFEKERKQLIDEVYEREALSNERLRQLSDKLLLATKVAGLGIWEYDVYQNKFIGDEMMFSLYGIKPEDFDGSYEAWMKFVHPEDREKIDTQFKETLEKQVDLNASFRIVWHDESVHFIDVVAHVQKDDVGNTRQIIGTNQVVTKRKEAELAIKQSEAKYRAFFENSMDGILLTSQEGEIMAANPAACTILGMTEEEICQKGRYGIVDITDSRLVPLMEERRRTGKAKGELTFIRKNGIKFPVEFSSRIFIDAYGNERTSMILRDVTDRKLSEQKQLDTAKALEEAWNDLKKIMDSSVDVICSIDEEGRFVNVSSAAQRIWGYKPNELHGLRYMDLVYKDDVKKTKKIASEVMNGMPVTIFENRYVRKNGETIPMLWSAKWDENDQLMYCVAKDATEKKKLEQAFENERNRFHEMFLNAPSSLGIFKGKEHVFEMANDLYLEMTGRKDIIGKTVRQVFPEIENQGVFELLDQVYTTGNTVVAKERLIRINNDGTGKLKDLYLNFVYQAYRNSENEIEGVFFFAINVTEQVESRKKIEESEKQFRQIVETAQEGIWMLDENNHTSFVNEKMCRILEYTEEEMIGKSPYFFLTPKSKKTADRFLSERRLETRVDTYEDEFVTKTGKLVLLYLSTNPIKDEENVYKGALAMVTDMTHRKRLEEKIVRQKVQQQKEITKAALLVQEKERNFLGSELHDNINQILTAVKLHLTHYIENPGTSIKIVENSHRYVNTAIEEIRKLSHKLVSHRFDEDSFIETIRFLVKELPNDKAVELNIDALDEDMVHESIKLTLFRIIQEQLNNITKYAAATKVEIRLENDATDVYLEINDNGVGFDPKRKRTGVGITNIHNRVESYNGKVKIESGLGKGCSLRLQIPLQQPLSPLNL